MDVLLDTHTVLWFFEGDEHLPKATVDYICNEENNKYIGIVWWHCGFHQ